MVLTNTLTVLIQRRSIKHRSIAARNEIMRQVRAIVERQTAPAIRRILSVLIVLLKGIDQTVETIVVSRSAVCDVPRATRVVQSLRVNVKFGHGRVSLVDVNVPGQDEIDVVLQEERLEDFAALFADCAASVGSADVPGAMAGYDKLAMYIKSPQIGISSD